MYQVDLNSDLGESFGNYTLEANDEIMRHVSSANVACGLHAGDPVVMAHTVALAKEYGVGVGAHPSYPDLQLSLIHICGKIKRGSPWAAPLFLNAKLDEKEGNMNQPQIMLLEMCIRDRALTAALVTLWCVGTLSPCPLRTEGMFVSLTLAS